MLSTATVNHPTSDFCR